MQKGLAFISPWMIGFCAFTLLPIGLSLYYSFCDFPMEKPPFYRGLENYHTIAHDPVFWKSLKVTAYFALVALPLGMIIALVCAMLLNVKMRGQAIYRTIVFLPSLVPAVASAMLWLWLFNSKLGLINKALGPIIFSAPAGWIESLINHLFTFKDGPFHFSTPGWFSDAFWVMPALILMSFWGVGNTVIIYLAGLQDVPRDLYEAAELDGAGTFAKIFHVTLPSISPVIFFNLVMAIIGCMQAFTVPQLIVPGGGPDRSAYFYTMYLYDEAFINLHMGKASAMAWIQLLIVLVLTALVFLSSKRWVHYQGK